MPKAQVTHNSAPSASSGATRTPIKINSSGTPMWYKVIMFGLMLLGVAWIVVFYLASNMIPLMVDLGPWNYAIGFGLLFVGLFMTMNWK